MAEDSHIQGTHDMVVNQELHNIYAAPSSSNNTDFVVSVDSSSSWFNNGRHQFVFCLLVTLLWPLLPFFFELVITDRIKLDSITLGASMYAVGIGVSSRNIALFGLCIFQGFIFATFYGHILSKDGNVPHYYLLLTLSIVGIMIILFSHAVERYDRHVRLREKFPDFFKFV